MRPPADSTVAPRLGSRLAGYARSLFTLALGPAVQFLALIALTHAASIEEVARYFVMTSLLPFLLCFSGLSASEAALKEIARHPEDTTRWTGNAFVLTLMTLPFLAAIYAAATSYLVPGVASFALLALVAIGELAGSRFLMIAEHTSLARHDTPRADGYRAMANMARPAGLFVAAAVSRDLTATAALVAGAAATFLTGCGVAYNMISKWGRPQFRLPTDLGSCLNFTANVAVRTSQFSLDRVLLSLVLPAASLANYAIAVRIFQPFLLPLTVVSREAVPRYFQKLAQADPALTAYARNIAVTLLATGAAVCLMLLAVAPAMPLVVGEKYDAAALLLRWLAPAAIFYAIYLAGQDLMTGLDLQKWRLAVNITYIGSQLAAITLAAMHFGLAGIVVAFLATSALGASLPWAALGLHFKNGRR